jgi:DNA-binding HxlR family transcriptional regulator
VTTRKYDQLCPVARALDVVGDRWNLLLVRELLLGPKRFKEFLTALPAIGPNRLSDRLTDLEANGIVARRTLPPPGDVPVYELTPFGERLRPVVVGLAAFGANLPADDSIDPATARPDLYALALAETSPAAMRTGKMGPYELHIGASIFHIRIENGKVSVRSGPCPTPADLTLTCTLDAFNALVRGATTPAQAVRAHHLRATGAPATLNHLFRILSAANFKRPLRITPT